MEKIRVAILNAPFIYEVGLKVFLKKYSNIIVVGSTSHRENIFQFILEKRPHVILVHINSIYLDCFSEIATLIYRYRHIKIVALSPNNKIQLEELVITGIHGIVLKDSAEDDIIDAISMVKSGNHFYSNKLCINVIEILKAKEDLTFRRKGFTSNQVNIIKCICEGMTNKEIASRMFLSTRTIEGYRLKILEKINARSSAHIIIYAVQMGIFTLENING